MKKKLLISTLLICVILTLNCFNVYAATISKSTLQNSILGYFDGTKTASTRITNSNINDGYKNCFIGAKDNTSREKKLFVEIAAYAFQNLDAIKKGTTNEDTFSITDNTITFKNALYIYEFDYSINETNNTIEFSIPVTILQSDKPDNAKLKFIAPEHLLSLLFVSTADIYSIPSNSSLFYYEESKSEVNNKVIQDETIYFPIEVDKNNPAKTTSFMFEDGYFPDVNTSVYSKKYEIIESSDSKFRYNISLKINLSNIADIQKGSISFVDPTQEDVAPIEEPTEYVDNTNNGLEADVLSKLLTNIIKHLILLFI